MGLISWLKQIASPLTAMRPQRDGILDFLNVQGGNSFGHPWTANRAAQAAHFRGWNYVGVRIICEEIALMPPQVGRIVDGGKAQVSRQKALKTATNWHERQIISQSLGRKYLTRAQRSKSLAHVQDSDEIEPIGSNDDLVKLLKNPNGPDTAWSFFYKLPLYLELTGNAYIYVVNDTRGKPCQLWVIPSQWVTDAPGQNANELVGEYIIRPTAGVVPGDAGFFGLGWFPGMGGQERAKADRIIKIAYPNPNSIIDGYSPLSATGQWNDVSEFIDSSRCQTFFNGAYPGVVLILDKEMGKQDPEALKRIAAEVDKKYAGVKNSGRTAVLAPGITMQAFRQTAVEMDWVNSGEQISNWQLAARRVPKSMTGLNEQESYASMVATRAGFYQGTIKPKLALIGQVLTEKLAKRFDEDRCIYWKDPTPTDPDMRLKEWTWKLDKGVVTLNEAREEFGHEKYEFGGDDPSLPIGSQIVTYATGHDPMEDLANQMNQQAQQPGMGDPAMGGDDGGAMDSVMQELLGDGSAGGDEPKAPESTGIPSPLMKRLTSLNGKAVNGNGKH